MTRTIIIGDIHGCFEEFEALLKKTGAGPSDRIIAVGDLVLKGPSTRRTLDLALSLPNLRCILGNHDLRLLRSWENRTLNDLDLPYQRETIRELGKDMDQYMSYIATWPFYLELEDCLVVHAGIRPGLPLKDQSESDLVSLRTLKPDNRPWYDDYRKTRLIVHGHWARQGLVVRENVIGLDTGCVYGKELTCVILPERKIVSVPAARVYCPPESS